ncbi:hypothetical protein J4Q44_G00181530 [Coregonus suidteri]|uniref:HTH CENPB-type domain-containing protein n=1 Tax=Coregonus suidteri TaxID=861788 RepID=A0AAN8LMQ4_9TELE
MADHAFPISRTVVKALVVAIIKESGRSTIVNLERGLSDNWWSRFRARHPELSARVPNTLNRARVHGATPATIKGFFDVYEPIFVSHGLEHKPHLIFNCDETGFADKPKSREKVLCQKGRKRIYQQQQHNTMERITVHYCTVFSMNAAHLGLVQGDLVIGKKHFSGMLREAYPQAVTKKNIMAVFKKAGIFPLNREAFYSSQQVKLLPTTPNLKAATSEATAGNPDPRAAEAPTTPATPTTPAATQSLVPGGCCPTCGQRVPPTNPLVAAGLVSPDLTNVLVPPVFQTFNRQKVKRRLLPPPASSQATKKEMPLPVQVFNFQVSSVSELEVAAEQAQDSERDREKSRASSSASEPPCPSHSSRPNLLLPFTAGDYVLSSSLSACSLLPEGAVEPMQIDADPQEDQQNAPDINYVVENPTLDLEQFASSYSGLMRIERLQFIAEHCPQLRAEALKMALSFVQRTFNVDVYEEIHRRLTDATRDVDQRGHTFQKSVHMGKEFQRRAKAMILRAAVLRNQIHVKSPPREGSQGELTTANSQTTRMSSTM